MDKSSEKIYVNDTLNNENENDLLNNYNKLNLGANFNLQNYSIEKIKETIAISTRHNSIFYKPKNPLPVKYAITEWLKQYPTAGYSPFRFSDLEIAVRLSKQQFQERFPSLAWIWSSDTELLSVHHKSIIKRECVNRLMDDLNGESLETTRTLWRDSIHWVTITACKMLYKDYRETNGVRPDVLDKKILKKFIRNIARLDNYGLFLAFQRILISKALQKPENDWLKNRYDLSMSDSILYNTCYGIHLSTRGAIEFSYIGCEATSLIMECDAGSMDNSEIFSILKNCSHIMDVSHSGIAYMVDNIQEKDTLHFIARSSNQIIGISVRYRDNRINKETRDSFALSLMSSAFNISSINYFKRRRIIKINNQYLLRDIPESEAKHLGPVTAKGETLSILLNNNDNNKHLDS